MSSDVLAPAPAVAYSPHALAAALNGRESAPLVPDAVAVAPPALPEPGADDGTEEATAGLLMFRVGAELFAAPLADVEEAIELSEVTPLPEMPPHMLGMIRLRGVTLPLFSPAHALGVQAGASLAALVVRVDGRRLALAIDDVEDVIDLRERDLRATPDLRDDRLLVAVAHHRGALVSALDVAALVSACAGTAREAA